MKAILALFCVLAARAAELRVTVQDPSGARVAAATVEVRTSAGASLAGRTSDTGEVVFDAPPGRAEVRISAAGFSPQTVWVVVRANGARTSPRLRIAPRKDEVSVSVDPREENTNQSGPAFSTVLTEDQIANLPDDPDEMEQVLKDMAGPGATIRVDGFLGARLPHKSQIKSIRFRITPYSADEHDPGFMLIDIQTKPGIGAWRGSLSFAFGDDALNARSFFSPVREPQQMRRVDATLTGPLRQGKTGSSFWYSRNSSYDSRASVGVLPEGPFTSMIRLPRDTTNANARFDHGAGKSHVLRGVYEYSGQERWSARDFDLPERRYATATSQHALRFSDTGSVSERTINEFRLQTSWNTASSFSASTAPAIVVQGAFSRGGAGVDSDRRWRDTGILDHFSFGQGRQTFKAGGQLDVLSHDDTDRSNGAGTFTFPSLPAWLAGRPQQYLQRQGQASVRFRQWLAGGYLQDDIRAAKNLSVSAGVRYEAQTGVGDRVNFAPRFGIAWSPFRHGTTTFRGGGGIFYRWLGADLYGQSLLFDGTRQSNLVVADPGYPDPLSGGVRAAPPPSVVRLAPSLTLPYTWRASAGVQQQVGKAFMLMGDVRVERGVHLWYGRNWNAPAPGFRPDPRFGIVTGLESGASQFQRGFMIALSPAPGAGLGKRYFWHVNYLYTRAQNQSDNALMPVADSYDRRADWGPSMADVRHRVAGMLQGSLGRGFKIGTMFRAQSAPPYNITTGIDNNHDLVLNDRPAGVGRNSARGAGQWYLDTRLSWTRGIGTRRPGDPAPVTRMIRIGDESRDIPDMGFAPKPGEKQPLVSAQLYGQVYNVFNHANLTNFVGVETSPYFGRPTASLPGRRLEVGLKFSF